MKKMRMRSSKVSKGSNNRNLKLNRKGKNNVLIQFINNLVTFRLRFRKIRKTKSANRYDRLIINNMFFIE